MDGLLAPPLTFQVEKLSAVREEVRPLLLEHWEEIALNKDAVRLNPDWDGYQKLEDGGFLHVTTARFCGQIVGYASYIVSVNLHYRTMLVADGDIFYLAKAQRKGAAGIRLLRAAEAHLIALAVGHGGDVDCVYIINKEKEHFRKEGRAIVGPVLNHLGYKLIEHYYAKRVAIA
jgi:hypothetical protein